MDLADVSKRQVENDGRAQFVTAAWMCSRRIRTKTAISDHMDESSPLMTLTGRSYLELRQMARRTF